MRKVCYMFAFLAVIGVCATASASDITVTNNSDWSIDQFYLSPVGQNAWGPDQLRDDVIGTGEHFLLKGVPCDSYDVKLVDEDGDDCVVGGVNICADNQGWLINSDDLLACQKATDDAKEDDDDDEEDDEDEDEDEDR